MELGYKLGLRHLSLMSFFRKMKNILCYFVFSRPQTKMLFSDRASKILCHHKNRGHKPLSLCSAFLCSAHFTIYSPPITTYCGKLFYLISDKTLLNLIHFLLLSNCYIGIKWVFVNLFQNFPITKYSQCKIDNYRKQIRNVIIST